MVVAILSRIGHEHQILAPWAKLAEQIQLCHGVVLQGLALYIRDLVEDLTNIIIVCCVAISGSYLVTNLQKYTCKSVHVQFLCCDFHMDMTVDVCIIKHFMGLLGIS